MPEFTYETIFKQQLDNCEPLTEESPQIESNRKDYFDDYFQVGDNQLFVKLVRGKASGLQDTIVEIASITPRSWEQLLKFYTFEPHYDSRTHQIQMDAIPRFIQKPFEQINGDTQDE